MVSHHFQNNIQTLSMAYSDSWFHLPTLGQAIVVASLFPEHTKHVLLQGFYVCSLFCLTYFSPTELHAISFTSGRSQLKWSLSWRFPHPTLHPSGKEHILIVPWIYVALMTNGLSLCFLLSLKQKLYECRDLVVIIAVFLVLRIIPSGHDLLNEWMCKWISWYSEKEWEIALDFFLNFLSNSRNPPATLEPRERAQVRESQAPWLISCIAVGLSYFTCIMGTVIASISAPLGEVNEGTWGKHLAQDKVHGSHYMSPMCYIIWEPVLTPPVPSAI